MERDSPAKTPGVADQRSSARRRVLLGGRLVYSEADLTVACSIRDLSQSGARVKVTGPVALPSKVHLIELRTGQAFECEVAWRNMPELGLRFLRAFDLNDGDPKTHFMLKRIWKESLARTAVLA